MFIEFETVERVSMAYIFFRSSGDLIFCFVLRTNVRLIVKQFLIDECDQSITKFMLLNLSHLVVCIAFHLFSILRKSHSCICKVLVQCFFVKAYFQTLIFLRYTKLCSPSRFSVICQLCVNFHVSFFFKVLL